MSNLKTRNTVFPFLFFSSVYEVVLSLFFFVFPSRIFPNERDVTFKKDAFLSSDFFSPFSIWEIPRCTSKLKGDKRNGIISSAVASGREAGGGGGGKKEQKRKISGGKKEFLSKDLSIPICDVILDIYSIFYFLRGFKSPSGSLQTVMELYMGKTKSVFVRSAISPMMPGEMTLVVPALLLPLLQVIAVGSGERQEMSNFSLPVFLVICFIHKGKEEAAKQRRRWKSRIGETSGLLSNKNFKIKKPNLFSPKKNTKNQCLVGSGGTKTPKECSGGDQKYQYCVTYKKGVLPQKNDFFKKKCHN